MGLSYAAAGRQAVSQPKNPQRSSAAKPQLRGPARRKLAARREPWPETSRRRSPARAFLSAAVEAAPRHCPGWIFGLRRFVAEGQYELSKGLFYGGSQPRRTREIVAEDFPVWLGEATSLVHPDSHTDLGRLASTDFAEGGRGDRCRNPDAPRAGTRRAIVERLTTAAICPCRLIRAGRELGYGSKSGKEKTAPPAPTCRSVRADAVHRRESVSVLATAAGGTVRR
ncbi:MAG: DUF2817 domain-containing protein [Planctomycetales bacterium]|nr:DUF2817 domain-containing protein [Planctomycetales bacterium]